jgi:hypothetical protein
MPITLSRVDVRVFDLHLSLAPLLNPALLRPPFAFLADRAAYSQQFVSGAPVDSARWTVRSSRRELRRSYFWKRYSSILVPGLDPAQPRPWDLQIPFRASPKGLDLRYGPAPAAPLRAVVSLFPSGWSSAIRLTLAGARTLDDVRAVVSELLKGTPFLLAGQPSTLSQVFRHLSQRIQQEILEDAGAAGEVPKTFRHVVLEIRSPEPLPGPWAGSGKMSEANRARLHGALLGSEVKTEQLIEREADKSFLCIRLVEHDDFALTYFQHGTVVSLTNRMFLGDAGRESPACLAANVHACSLMSQLLASYLEDAEALAPGDARAAALYEAARSAVRELPKRYNNPFCRGLFGKNSRLQSAQQRQPIAPKAAPPAP